MSAVVGEAVVGGFVDCWRGGLPGTVWRKDRIVHCNSILCMPHALTKASLCSYVILYQCQHKDEVQQFVALRDLSSQQNC